LYFDDEEDASDGLLRLRTGQADPLEDLGVDPDISRVVQRAIARDPNERWADASDFAEAFREIVAPEQKSREDHQPSEPATDSPAPTRQRPRATPDTPSGPSGPSEPREREPGPSDLLLTLIVAALLFSNLGWVYYISYTDGQQTGTAQETSVLPAKGGIKIESDPSGATVRTMRGEEASRVGETPFVVSEGLLDDEVLELEVRKDGFEPARIRIDRSDEYQKVVVPLDANE
jgi:hypothetical protein